MSAKKFSGTSKGVSRTQQASSMSSIRTRMPSSLGGIGSSSRPGNPSIESRLTSAIQREASREEFKKILGPKDPIFSDTQIDDMNDVLDNLRTVNGQKMKDRSIEFEIRFLSKEDATSLVRFDRLRNYFSQNPDYANIGPVEFKETNRKVTQEELEPENGYYYVYVTRTYEDGKVKSYIKITKDDKAAISKKSSVDDSEYARSSSLFLLPSINQLTPKASLSAEFEISLNNQAGSEVDTKTRWSYPIVEGDNLKAVVDFTILRKHNGLVSYSVELELDSNTITSTREKQGLFGNNKVYQYYITKDQFNFIDRIIRKISIVYNMSGVFMTTSEYQEIAASFNSTFTKSGSVAIANRSTMTTDPKTRKNIYIDKSLINQPTDLQIRDISWLNPSRDSDAFSSLTDLDHNETRKSNDLRKQGLFMPLMAIPGGYYISLKADGTRVILYFMADGIYIIHPFTGIITKMSGRGTISPDVYGILTGTILDCEYIGEFNPDGTAANNGHYNFLIFDILCHENNVVVGMTYTERLVKINTVVNYLADDAIINSISNRNKKNLSSEEVLQYNMTGRKTYTMRQLMSIQAKPVYRLPTIHLSDGSGGESIISGKYDPMTVIEFYNILGRVAEASIRSAATPSVEVDGEKFKTFDQQTGTIKWRTDGCILTPAEEPYVLKFNKYNQQLTKQDNFSLTRKWKYELTVDFQLIISPDTGKLTIGSYDGIVSKKVIPFKSNNIKWNGNVEIPPKGQIGDIYEFKWGYSDEFSDYAFIPVRHRIDRIYSNPLSIADSVWSIINNPITLNQLRGDTMFAMNRYHNKVKTSMIRDLANKLGGANRVILYDIGGGAGGDIGKWTALSRVYTAEPDEINSREFIRRKTKRPELDYNLSNQGHYDRLNNLFSEANSGIVGDKSNIISGRLNTSADQSSSSSMGRMTFGGSVITSRIADTVGKTSSISNISGDDGTGIDEDKRFITDNGDGGNIESNGIPGGNNITFINTEGQNVSELLKKIPTNRVNAVTCFNVLTFFYKDLTAIKSLIDSIKTFLLVGGYCYFIALDGEMMLNSMRSNENAPNNDINISGPTESTYNTIKTKNITISKAEDNSCRKIWISIRDGIVRGQYEYLINITEFIEIMSSNGFRLIEDRYLDEELLLTKEEYWFSSMFRLLKFKFGSNGVKTEINEIRKEFLNKTMNGISAINPLLPSDQPELIMSSWASTVIQDPKLIRFGVENDGSNFLRAVLTAKSKEYNRKLSNEQKLMINELRYELQKLYTPGIHSLIGGVFFQNSTIPAYQYDRIRNSIGNDLYWFIPALMQFIGEVLNVNVHVLYGQNAFPYNFGANPTHIKPNRPNIILYLINENRYETIGLREGPDTIRTVFGDDHPLIIGLTKYRLSK